MYGKTTEHQQDNIDVAEVQLPGAMDQDAAKRERKQQCGMFYSARHQVSGDQVADQDERVPVCGSKNEKVDDLRNFKIQEGVRQKKEEGGRTVFVKP